MTILYEMMLELGYSENLSVKEALSELRLPVLDRILLRIKL